MWHEDGCGSCFNVSNMTKTYKDIFSEDETETCPAGDAPKMATQESQASLTSGKRLVKDQPRI